MEDITRMSSKREISNWMSTFMQRHSRILVSKYIMKI